MSGGSPGVSLDVRSLAISAKSIHAPAAWMLIQYLTSPSTEITRMLTTGDLPAVKAAYTTAIFTRYPLLKVMKSVIDSAAVRSPTASYGLVTARLQTALAKALANKVSASTALLAVGGEIATLAGNR
jgi:ABC-type glycerol-3-phosphate transport system substrate-binding protein